MANLVKNGEFIPRTVRVSRVRKIFLAELAASCNVSAACRAAGVSNRAMYDWKADDTVFAAEWAEAESRAADLLVAEAWRRGVDGYDAPVTYQGQITATYREYSDRMLEILIKGHRPQYRESTRTEITGADGGPLRVADVTDQERSAAVALLVARGKLIP